MVNGVAQDSSAAAHIYVSGCNDRVSGAYVNVSGSSDVVSMVETSSHPLVVIGDGESG